MAKPSARLTGSILLVAVLLVVLVAIYCICRFGLTFVGVLRGDGSALLEATSAVVGIWGLVVTLGTTAAGATFQLSRVPTRLKFRLLGRHIACRIWPFPSLAFMAGVIPFAAMLGISTELGVWVSPVTPWVLLSFILQFLLIASAVATAYSIYELLSVTSALSAVLSATNDHTLGILAAAHKAAWANDYGEDHKPITLLMDGYGRSFEGDARDYHLDLRDAVTTLLRETTPETLDRGIEIMSTWLQSVDAGAADAYFNHRLLPECFRSLSTDRANNLPAVFQARLYHMALLIIALKDAGAGLAAANAGNPLWELIADYGQTTTMSLAFDLVTTQAGSGVERGMKGEPARAS